MANAGMASSPISVPSDDDAPAPHTRRKFGNCQALVTAFMGMTVTHHRRKGNGGYAVSVVASSPVNPAPGELEFVRRFVNTFNLEADVDQLSSPGDARMWAAEHGVDIDATPGELDDLRGLRESLRVAMLANHDGTLLPDETVDALNAASVRTPVVMHFTADGTRLTSTASGVDLLYARLLTAISAAMADNSWTRLKACASDACQWGFYDTSRSRSGQWCSMSICGNRAKQARYRKAAAQRNGDVPAGD